MVAAPSLTRLLMLPVMTAALVIGTPWVASRAAAATDSMEAANCCQDVPSRCCGSACCEMPADQSERSPANPAERSNSRWQDGQAVWSSGMLLGPTTEQVTAGLRRLSERTPTSGSPSLIAEHVRLQI